MDSGSQQQIVQVLQQALNRLGLSVPSPAMEAIAGCIHTALSADGRNFHTAEHVLSLVDPANPVQSLAALFHDLVYYQVDRGFCAEAYAIFSPYVSDIGGDRFQIRQEILNVRSCALALDCFGLSPGQVLAPSAGLNEFLSALVMCRKLEAFLPEKELLKAVIYVEMTIPFRCVDTDQSGPCFDLAHRLKGICERYSIPMSAAEQAQTIQGAALFANQDVRNFALSDPLAFLDRTWQLLPETNLALRSNQGPSIREYRLALQNMYLSMVRLDPLTVFRHYQGVPSQTEVHRLQQTAGQNVTLTNQYLMTKLFSIALLEALASATGGDAPLQSFMGAHAERRLSQPRLEDYLPQAQPEPTVDLSGPLYRLFISGRTTQVSFDMNHSPISLFLYKSLGLEAIRQGLEHAFEMFSGLLSPEQFLSTQDAEIVSALASACSAMMPDRRIQLAGFINPK